MLLYKVPKVKINSKTLGYISSNGNINFQSEEVALKYAKNMVLKTLHSSNPVERALIIKDSRIIADKLGDYSSVDLGNINKLDTSLIHGHPEPTPISIYDAKYLLLSGAKLRLHIMLKGNILDLML